MLNMHISRRRTITAILTLVVFIGILLATLWPLQFHPTNDVRWVARANALQFGKHGIVLSEEYISLEEPGDDSSCSLEILLKPASVSQVSTILTVSRTGHPAQFQLRQYHDGIIILHEPTIGAKGRPHDGLIKRDVDHFFRLERSTLLTLTSGPKGTDVYVDGHLVKKFPNYMLSRGKLSGQLVLGTFPAHIDPWAGELQGLAMYAQELDESQVRKHYSDWCSESFEAFGSEEHRRSLFFFDEHSGSVAHNRVSRGANLIIPVYFQLPLKPFLAPPWKEFERSWAYVNDVARNIIGFIPLGFALCAYLSFGRMRHRAVWIAISAGALTSLGIELMQAYIPQRESGMTDVITNTSGTALGVLLYRCTGSKRFGNGLFAISRHKDWMIRRNVSRSHATPSLTPERREE